MEWTTRSDPSGHFSFAGLPYSLTVHKDGFADP
jgi:hypothetical protein